MTVSEILWCISVFFLAAGLIVQCVTYYSRDHALQAIRDFKSAFPGRCVICAYHAYGVREGFIPPTETVGKHDCIERLTHGL